MRIVVALIHHESNSFNPNLTTVNEFKILSDEKIFKNIDMLENSSLKGIIDTLATNKEIEIIPTVAVLPTAEGGLIEKESYEYFKSIYLNRIKKLKNIDGVCLALHGSMTTEDHIDVEGDILKHTKNILGENIPISVALDMHAMITQKMIDNSNIIVGYRTAPHIDKYETGERAAELLLKILDENIKTKISFKKIPILVSGEMSKTSEYPMKDLLTQMEKIEKDDEDILSTSYFLGFPWADVSFNNASAVVVTKDNYKRSKNVANKLAKNLWFKRNKFDFTSPAYSLEDSLIKAKDNDQSPIFVIDSGDNPGAGSSQNNLEVLLNLLKKDLPKTLYISINKPKIVKKVLEVGEKNYINLNFGKAKDYKFYIKKIAEFNGVQSILLNNKNLDVIIANQKVVVQDPNFVFNLNVSINDYKIVITKSGYLSPEYEKYAKKTYLAITPGYTYQDFSKLEYNNIPRPIYPLDEIEDKVIESEKN